VSVVTLGQKLGEPLSSLVSLPSTLCCGPQIQLTGLWSAFSSLNGVWGGAQPKLDFDAFYLFNLGFFTVHKFCAKDSRQFTRAAQRLS